MVDVINVFVKHYFSGMIEAVVPTATTAKIVAEHGGMLSAMRSTPLLSWLIDRARVRTIVD